MRRVFSPAQVLVCFILAPGLILSVIHFAYADSAVVLPRGYGFASAEYRHLLPTEERYDQDGNSVTIGSDLSRNLTGSVFSQLTALNPFVGGTASIGTSEVEHVLATQCIVQS